MNKTWDEVFFNMATEVATMSKYAGYHVGCVIVKDKRILSVGVNGYTPGVDDDFFNNLDRDERLKFAIHAEENAIINAAKYGTVIKDATAYVTHMSCASCTSRLASAGISKIKYLEDEEFEKKWANENIKYLPIEIEAASEGKKYVFDLVFLGGDNRNYRQFSSFESVLLTKDTLGNIVQFSNSTDDSKFIEIEKSPNGDFISKAKSNVLDNMMKDVDCDTFKYYGYDLLDYDKSIYSLYETTEDSDKDKIRILKYEV